jgi:hypothetical protein
LRQSPFYSFRQLPLHVQQKKEHMNWIVIAAGILAIAAIILVKLPKKNETEAEGYPFQKKEVLFSPAERSFYGTLNQAVGESAKIFGKVRVADVVTPRKGLSPSDWQKAFNKINCKHFDFILCDYDDLSVICAIELDDRSHQARDRKERDEFLNGVCDAAGLPLIQVSAKSGYVIDDIKQLLAPHLDINELSSQETEPPQIESAMCKKVCPKCSSPMVIRVAKKGINVGKQFRACSAFPKCKHIEAIEGGK